MTLRFPSVRQARARAVRIDTPTTSAYIFVGPPRMSSIPFGEHLRRERELRGVSLEEIAAATRISTRFLEALENEQWDRLPGGAFNRGFIRSIARFLGLDEDGLVAEYSYERNSSDDPRAAGHAGRIPRAWGSVIVVALVAGLILAGGFWALEHFHTALMARFHGRFAGGSATGGDATAGSPSGTVTRPSTLSPPSSEGRTPPVTDLSLMVEVTKPADLTVTADGQTVFAGSLQGGDVKQFKAHEALEIASSDSTAFGLTLNGHPTQWAGAPGDPGKMKLTRSNLATSLEASH
jgi:cytoskeleton protein RodZ